MKECQNPKTWRHCGQRHHQSIFFVACQESPRPKEISPKETKTITTTERNKAKATVLCWAVNNVISETASVRILLDTGSQRRYIKNRSKSKLNLSPVKLTIKGPCSIIFRYVHTRTCRPCMIRLQYILVYIYYHILSHVVFLLSLVFFYIVWCILPRYF